MFYLEFYIQYFDLSIITFIIYFPASSHLVDYYCMVDQAAQS